MGVVYKFNKDVKDFILEQKRLNPHASCRSLVVIVQEAFRIKVSKSSINAVLKEAALSSPVGRRPAFGKASRKFQIPAEKRKGLFASETKKDPAPASQSTRGHEQKETSAKELVVKASASKDKNLGAKTLYDGMGCFFLKAAERLLSDRSLIGAIVGDDIADLEPSQLEQAGDALLYSRCFGIKDIKDFTQYSQEGLFVLSSGEKTDVDFLSTFSGRVSQIANLDFIASIKISEFLSEVNCFKILQEDGNFFCMDPQLGTFWPYNVQSELSLPVNHAMTIVSKNIIQNVHSANVFSLPLEQGKNNLSFSKQAWSFIEAFENMRGRKITKISLFDAHQKETAHFTNILDKRRIFVAGIWPWQIDFNRIAKKKIGKDQEFSLKWPERKFSFSQLALPHTVKDESSFLRWFMLYDHSSGDPIVSMISNAREDQASGDEIIKEYLEKWPNLNSSPFYYLMNPKKEYPFAAQARRKTQPKKQDDISVTNYFTDSYDIPSLIEMLFSVLNKQTQKYFFPSLLDKEDPSFMVEHFYSLPGYVTRRDEAFLIDLRLPENFPYKKELAFAILRANELDIRDKNGRKMIFR